MMATSRVAVPAAAAAGLARRVVAVRLGRLAVRLLLHVNHELRPLRILARFHHLIGGRRRLGSPAQNCIRLWLIGDRELRPVVVGRRFGQESFWTAAVVVRSLFVVAVAAARRRRRQRTLAGAPTCQSTPPRYFYFRLQSGPKMLSVEVAARLDEAPANHLRGRQHLRLHCSERGNCIATAWRRRCYGIKYRVRIFLTRRCR